MPRPSPPLAHVFQWYGRREGWRVLPTRYDDPAYSGGNLDRPALQRLLKDLHADMVDVVVVYKIDRLTRFC